MGINFVAIDFETANEKRASVCSVALIFFENGKVVKELEWLVRPPTHLYYFNPFNVQIHGIHESDVADKPEFSFIWQQIYPLINNKILVAHNASFDMSVLKQILDCYQLPYPNIEFICTCNVSRKTWDKQINYTLKTIGNYLGYIFDHHDAHDDARTCGKILVDACKYHDCNSVNELAKKISMQIGVLKGDYYSPCSIHSPYQKIQKSKYERVNINEIESNNIKSETFIGKNVVFTGTLLSMTRQVAAQKVVECCGNVSNTINRDTNLLVMGIQDYDKFVDHHESSKTKKAKELIEEGHFVEIIDENEFLRLLLQEA